jgi:hypothetical protein
MLASASSDRAVPSTLNAVDSAPPRGRQEAAWTGGAHVRRCDPDAEDRS